MDDKPMGSFKAAQGGVYSLLVAKDPKTAIDRTHSFVLTEPNSIHILWLIPQYFVITASEIMISVTGNFKSKIETYYLSFTPTQGWSSPTARRLTP